MAIAAGQLAVFKAVRDGTPAEAAFRPVNSPLAQPEAAFLRKSHGRCRVLPGVTIVDARVSSGCSCCSEFDAYRAQQRRPSRLFSDLKNLRGVRKLKTGPRQLSQYLFYHIRDPAPTR